MKRIAVILFLGMSLLMTSSAWAIQCQAVGGVLMTSIGAIAAARSGIEYRRWGAFGIHGREGNVGRGVTRSHNKGRLSLGGLCNYSTQTDN